MKTRTTAVLAAAFLATTSFATFAASPVSSEQAAGLNKLGTVSVSGVHGSFDDAKAQLQEKAQAQGASHYRIIGVNNPGDSSRWMGSAEIYQ
ncbi:protein ydgH Flags: Precursor [Enterobacterales bacterium CwR94]|nr:protein ydgH Flags: Precursor [Enterobacterales bacterium CwR94]